MGQRTLERDSLLFTQSVISAADYETSVQNYLAKQNSKAGFDATLTSTELSILQTEQQLVELSVQRENEVAEYERTIGQLRQQLLAAIAQWQEQYAVIAPMDGIVSLQGYWSKGQHVTVGSALASIVPEKETEVIGRIRQGGNRADGQRQTERLPLYGVWRPERYDTLHFLGSGFGANRDRYDDRLYGRSRISRRDEDDL